MELVQLKCFLAISEELHFGRAAQKLEMLPATLGRHLRILEDELGTQLILRTTRQVSLSEAGAQLTDDATRLLAMADAFEEKARNANREHAMTLRVGAIDSASLGMMPQLLSLFRYHHPEIEVTLHEQKTSKLLPRLLSGSLDIVFIRKPEQFNNKIMFRHLLQETAVVAIPISHPLANRSALSVHDLASEAMIVPDRGARPHSHDLTMKLFSEAGFHAHVGQTAEEKHTILNMVSNGLGLAIVPKWTSRLAVQDVKYIPLRTAEGDAIRRLDLSAAWLANTRDICRKQLMDCTRANLDKIAETA